MEERWTQLIERFFDNALSDADAIEFDQLFENDEAFKKEALLTERAIKVTKLNAQKELTDKIRALDHSLRSRSGTSWIRAAVAVIIVGFVGLVFYAQRFNNDNLYSSSFSPLADEITNLDDSITDLEQAISFYNLFDYNEAAYRFKSIMDTDPDNQTAAFYYGNCLLLMDDYQNALGVFESLNDMYYWEGQWYLALTYLKLNQEDKTKEILSRIVRESDDEAIINRASHLQKSLNSPLRKLAF